MLRKLKKLGGLMMILLAIGVVGYQWLINADYSYSGTGKTYSEVFNGTVSLRGENNTLTIRSGSTVSTLTLVGNSNTIYIEPGATLGAVRGGGQHNQIIAPPGITFDRSMYVDEALLKGKNGSAEAPASAPASTDSLDGF
ncbi:MAG: hypothetical protein HJJLKODD_02151 [Phycisphaerae bacterium]|nr:hypothetical protein [Phycisphaerae bacterium]